MSGRLAVVVGLSSAGRAFGVFAVCVGVGEPFVVLVYGVLWSAPPSWSEVRVGVYGEHWDASFPAHHCLYRVPEEVHLVCVVAHR